MERIQWDEKTSNDYYEDVRTVVKYDYTPWAGIMAGCLGESGEGPVIADLGCGPGLMARELAGVLPRASFVLMDAAPAMMNLARKETDHLSPRVKILTSGAEQVPLKASTSDVAVCKHFLLQVDNMDRVFREVHRILRPGGTLFIVDFHREASVVKAALIRMVIRFKMGSARASRFWMAYRSAIPREDLFRRLKEAGFSPERVACRGVNILVRAGKTVG